MKTFSSNDILDRLKIALQVGTDKELADKLGLQNTTISNWRKRNSIDLPLVFSFCEYINMDWLLTGRGNKVDPIKKPELAPTIIEPSIETRPRIPFDAAAGSLSLAIQGLSSADCEQIPIIPTLPHYDFSIIARGDSMYPEFMSGDELACAFVHETSFIQWGRAHILDTAQGVVLKKIFDKKTSILCRSINLDYPDFEIPKNDIYHLAIVVGLIRHF